MLLWRAGRILEVDDLWGDLLPRLSAPPGGLFETARTTGDVAPLLELHLARMARSAVALGIPLPVEWQEVRESSGHLLAAQGLQGPGRLRVVLPAGGPLLLTADPVPPGRVEGAVAGISAVSLEFNRGGPPLAGHKTLTGLVTSLRGLQEAHSKGAEEGLLLGPDGCLLEGCVTNLFLVDREGCLRTHPNDGWILPGTTRARVLARMAERGRTAREEPVSAGDLDGAREAFLTNSLYGVAPLLMLDGELVGDGQPGPVTRKLAGLIR